MMGEYGAAILRNAYIEGNIETQIVIPITRQNMNDMHIFFNFQSNHISYLIYALKLS